MLALASLLSCTDSKLRSEMGCDAVSFDNLETVEDVHKQFSVRLPDTWKTNLYYDASQSSIFSADTTKQLTDTYLVDITQIKGALDFDNDFIHNFKNSLNANNLVETSAFETPFLKKEAYYSRALGKKGDFPYQIINIFIKSGQNAHLHAKAEVYGDSLANQRLCSAIQLLEKIAILQ